MNSIINLVIDGVRIKRIRKDIFPKIVVELEIPVPNDPQKENVFYYLTTANKIVTYLVHEGFIPEREVISKIKPVHIN